MNDATTPEGCSLRGEFYYCLARAFLTPWQPEDYMALRDTLAEDLDELNASLGYGLTTEVADYRRAITTLTDHPTLLQRYSALFVAPPRAVQINASAYLDGTFNGATVSSLEAVYRQCGLERNPGFHDLADHLSVQLEFVAQLYFRHAEALENAQTAEPPIRAGHFLHQFISRGLPGFIGDLQAYARKAGLDDDPYLALASILRVAVSHDLEIQELPAAQQRAQRAISKARHTRAARGITDEDMARIAEKLRAKGLSTDHLAIAPELRDAAQGLTRKQTPSVRRGMR